MDFLEKLDLSGQAWVLQVFVVVLIFLVVDFIQRRVLKRFEARLAATPNPWDDAVLTSARAPLGLLIWVVGLSIAVQVVDANAKTDLFVYVEPARNIGVIVCITWFLVRFIKQAEVNIIQARRSKGVDVDVTTMDAITKLLRLAVMITAALVVLQTLGFSISGVLAFGGVGGIAVGFAARDMLANFFGGLMIYLDRPFSVGDWIRSPDRNIEGTVENIGWRLTVIRTFDKRPLYVPNNVFTSIAVENPSRMLNRRIYETIGIRYDDAAKMANIVAEVEAMLRSHSDIDQQQTLMVNFNSFAPSSLDFFVYTFTRTTNWVAYHQVKQDVLLKINDIIAAHGAQIAFPTSTLHVADEVMMRQMT
ncbi:MAG: mechanosensitive ion channel family protein [Gammaproteobacteria bacterium]|nr:mechanosensitive ion channel family protein [Gammaproteobacteria bacterium]MDH5803024.1 mechanosensitive ion channel family protein [Gammaproteobacteria bacterium]